MPATTTPTPMEALLHINEIATSYLRCYTLFAACELDVFEHLNAGPISAEELATLLRIHADGCHRLLVCLVSCGLVEREGSLYRNSPMGKCLTASSPIPYRALGLSVKMFAPLMACLPDALREYSPRWQQAFGSTSNEIWTAMYADPIHLRQFADTMNALAIPQGQLLADTYDFSPFRCLLDVAGGPGGIAIQIGLRYPQLHGIIMDLPPVCGIANGEIAAKGLAGRFQTATADLFDGPYPTGADVVLLSYILHDWDDSHCHTILRHCHKALPPAGVLLLNEGVLNNDHSGTPYSELLSLLMLVACDPGAKERTEEEYRALLEGAGFQMERVIRLQAPRDVIVARKP